MWSTQLTSHTWNHLSEPWWSRGTPRSIPETPGRACSMQSLQKSRQGPGTRKGRSTLCNLYKSPGREEEPHQPLHNRKAIETGREGVSHQSLQNSSREGTLCSVWRSWGREGTLHSIPRTWAEKESSLCPQNTPSPPHSQNLSRKGTLQALQQCYSGARTEKSGGPQVTGRKAVWAPSRRKGNP